MQSNGWLMFSVPFYKGESPKLRFLALIMNGSLPIWGPRMIRIYLSLIDAVGQMVLNRDEINQNSFSELSLCYIVS